MATPEQIINDQHDATRGLTVQQRADIKVMAATIKQAILNSPIHSRSHHSIIAYTAILNVLGDCIATFFQDDEAERVRIVQTLLPMYVAAYRTKEKKL